MRFHWRFVVATAAALFVQADVQEQEVGVGGESDPEVPPRCEWARLDTNHIKMTRTVQSFSEFIVAGVNLANYWPKDGILEDKDKQEAEPFELYDSFDIGDQIKGDEGFWDLLRYRQLLQRPTNSFYYDKIAIKRWLPTIGIEIPRSIAIKYGAELSPSHDPKEEQEAILSLIPANAAESDIAIKPAHMSLTHGAWLLSHDDKTNITLASGHGTAVKDLGGEGFILDDVKQEISEMLSDSLRAKAVDWESWTLNNVKPGVVIEERYTALECYECPPPEFKVFTIWGRVWMAQLNWVDGQKKWHGGNFWRNGTMIPGRGSGGPNPYFDRAMASWIDFPKLVEIAERTGANKDMLRTDIFVGVPAGSALPEEAPMDARVAQVKYVLSEFSFHPTTMFFDDEVMEEGARLWIAGYKMGNYKTVPNTQVPKVFVETGFLPEEAVSTD